MTYRKKHPEPLIVTAVVKKKGAAMESGDARISANRCGARARSDDRGVWD
jgi:hypothetical protein